MSKEDKRAKFNEEAFERSKKTEAYFDLLLSMYCPLKGWTHTWYNEKGETGKHWDFALFENGRNLCLIECEGKGFIYEKFYKEGGLDLVYRKVVRPYPRKCYYVMPIGSDDGYHYILYHTIDAIKYYGEKIRKFTGRDRNKKESFWRIPFDKMKILQPSIKDINV